MQGGTAVARLDDFYEVRLTLVQAPKLQLPPSAAAATAKTAEAEAMLKDDASSAQRLASTPALAAAQVAAEDGSKYRWVWALMDVALLAGAHSAGAEPLQASQKRELITELNRRMRLTADAAAVNKAMQAEGVSGQATGAVKSLFCCLCSLSLVILTGFGSNIFQQRFSRTVEFCQIFAHCKDAVSWAAFAAATNWQLRFC